ncbi:MAG: Orn/Lys/Arg decarboxylase N-terminal domain-containing protein [Acidimicrobiales bacterium]
MNPNFPVLLIDDPSRPERTGSSIDGLAAALERAGVGVMRRFTNDDAATLASLSSRVAAFVYCALDCRGEVIERTALVEFVQAVRAKNSTVPIYLFGQRITAAAMPLSILKEVQGFVNTFEETDDYVARGIAHAARDYLDAVAPPFFRALTNYVESGANSWHTPGHSGGAAFLKSPVGTMFHQFFGENMLRADVCNAVEELGQLLDHTGPVADAERNAARIFSADHLFFVTNGTSTSNKIVWNAMVSPGDVIVVDRNCHKSVLHALILTGAVPIFLTPTRNQAGIIGPIPRHEFSPQSIRAKIESNPFVLDKAARPRMLTITQSTYDGIIYNVEAIKASLDGEVDAFHFDEAWLPHATFHDFYKGMHAIGRDRPRCAKSLIFATQSTHKLLAGLSQASQILVQESESEDFDEKIFNEAFLMHTSTSPQYAIIASCDVAAAMMDRPGGTALVEEALTEALEFRRAIIRIGEELAGTWWFQVWGPDTPLRQGVGERPDWELDPDNDWHGFPDIEAGFTMLDPLKVTVLTPGLDLTGAFAEAGVPACVLTRYLAEHGVIVEKTGLYSFLALFTIGATKGRWNTLITQLQRFKDAYDLNLPTAQAMPRFAKSQMMYERIGLRDLCQGIHELYRTHDIARLTTDMYTSDLVPEMLPSDAWAQMTRRNVERVPLAQLVGRTTAVLLTPYPPGIPLLIPGERFNTTIVDYLRFAESFNQLYPGLEALIHGAETVTAGGKSHLYVHCLK